MNDSDLEKFFGDKNWHKTNAKGKLLSKFKKQLKGATNADLYKDASGEILLRGNSNGVWVKTGMH
jgi:hypothetical protein